MEHQVVCLHPHIIINPNLPELISKYGSYIFRGKLYTTPKHYKHWNYLYNFDYSPFSVKNKHITKEDFDSCFVLGFDGDTYPIYLEVPCGKCELCKDSKINSFVQRCNYETELYDNKPWFITLTYDDEHLPEFGVSVREAQLFLKRFRINLERSGFENKIRYVCVGEYGKNTHRAHYHLLVWNIPAYTHTEYLAVSKIIDKSWTKGFNQHRLVDPSNDKTFYYTAKYLKKEGKLRYKPVKDILDLDGNHIATEIVRENDFFVIQAVETAELVQDLYENMQTKYDEDLLQSIDTLDVGLDVLKSLFGRDMF